jgi:hypothetical protein
MLGDTLTVRAAQTSAAAGSVDLYLGSGLRCPDANDSSVSLVGKGAFSQYSIELDSDLGLQIFGLRSDQATDVILFVEGVNANNADLGSWISMSGLFVAASLLLLAALFVHAILARRRVHYLVETDE